MAAETLGYLTIDSKGRVTIPADLRRELGIDENTPIRVDRTDAGTFELVPAAIVPRDQLWYHAEEGRARLRVAEEDLRSGRSTRVSGPDDAQRHLDALKKRRAPKAGGR